MNYQDFIGKKLKTPFQPGIEVSDKDINPKLFTFQRAIVKWALFRGKAALFEGCGAGKTGQQLEWAHHVSQKGRVLLLAPLAVSAQTLKEAEKFNISSVEISRDGNFTKDIVITNYERLHYFNPDDFTGIVLDESGCIKNHAGTLRNQITEFAMQMQYRLPCSATPAPNDYMELGTHSEFLSQMRRVEMLATFFQHDGSDTSNWILKGHAQDAFWQWMATWCVAMEKPQDLGYNDVDYTLPPLNMHNIVVESKSLEGMLFVQHAKTLEERRNARRSSLKERVAAAAEIANSTDEQVLVWCDLNVESEALKKAINGAIEVKGSDDAEYKESALLGFAEGKHRVLVSKPVIASHGLNFQNCAKAVFVGLSDSFEQMYQAIRRCWRYGQTRPVDTYIITSEAEGAVIENIKRKEKQAEMMFKQLIDKMKIHELNMINHRSDNYSADKRMILPSFLTKGV